MFGLGVLKGLGITFKHFVNTFVDDLKYFPSSTYNKEAFARRQGPEGAGLFTVEYPEQKLQTPENFRFIPFLVTDYDVAREDESYSWDQATAQNRCTSCGICSKVCPPQCIWIVRTNDPDTGKPIPQPAEFYIDTDICMNCGYCAEFCPFDAIKMDHDFELADYEREVGHVHDIQRLLKPISYYAEIRPNWYAKEEEAKRLAEEEKRRKEEEKRRQKEAKAKAAAEAKAADGKQADAATPKKKTPEEIKAQREAMLAKKQARAAKSEGATAEQQPAKSEAVAAPAKPDDLTKIEGIGPVISKALGAAGITTFAGLATSKADDLRDILHKAELRQLHDPTTWPEQAQLAADGKWDELKKLQDELQGGVRVTDDDLTKIEGIGPVIAKTFNAAGIRTFSQLASADVDRLKQILNDAKLRQIHDPSTWPEQANLAAAGKWDELEKLQDELQGGRRV